MRVSLQTVIFSVRTEIVYVLFYWVDEDVIVGFVTNCSIMFCSADGQVRSLHSGVGFNPRYELNLHFSCPAYKGGQAGSDYALFGT